MSVRHVQRPATKEVFYSPTTGTSVAESGTHVGYALDVAARECYIEVHVPHDFKKLEGITVVFVAGATSALMTVTITVNYARQGQYYAHHVGGARNYSFPTTLNFIGEVDFTDIMNQGPLNRRDYIGIRVVAVANTNALVLGARMKYK